MDIADLYTIWMIYVCIYCIYIRSGNCFQVTGEQKKAHRYNDGSRKNTSVIVLLITHIVMVVSST